MCRNDTFYYFEAAVLKNLWKKVKNIESCHKEYYQGEATSKQAITYKGKRDLCEK